MSIVDTMDDRSFDVSSRQSSIAKAQKPPSLNRSIDGRLDYTCHYSKCRWCFTILASSYLSIGRLQDAADFNNIARQTVDCVYISY